MMLPNALKHQVPKPVKNPVVTAVPATTPTVATVLGWLGLLFGAGGAGFGFFTVVALVLELSSVVLL